MEQGFPIQGEVARQVTNSTVAMHVVLSAMLITAILRLFLSNRRAARLQDLWWWLFLVLATPAIGFAIPGDDRLVRAEILPGVWRYLFLIWLLAAIGAFVTLFRVDKKSGLGVIAWSVVYIAFLGYFIGMMLPTLSYPREAAWRTQCKNNLKQLGLAFHNYLDEHKAFPGPTMGEPAVSWRVSILPYLEATRVLKSYDMHHAWDADQNLPVIAQRPSQLTCPSQPGYPGVKEVTRENMFHWPTSYVMPTGPGTIGQSNRGVRPKDISDGFFNTILLTEACGLQIIWTEPRDFDASKQPIGVNFRGTEQRDSPGFASSYHKGGAHVELADGSVRFISENINPEVLESLITVAGHEEMGDW
jgi:hypothetical protein